MLFWMCLLAVSILTSRPVLCADDPNGDKVVPIKTANGTAAVKVHDATNPYKNLHVPAPEASNDPAKNNYDPTKYSLNQSSSLANKSFLSGSIDVSKKDSDLVHGQNAFMMKSFSAASSADLTRTSNTKFSTSNTSDYNHGDAQDERNYSTPKPDADSSRSSSFTSTSTDQGRTASLGKTKTDVFSSGLSKQYTGPGAQHVPDGSVKENVVLEHVGDLPNHPLSIDDVRGLINHGFKPDSDNKASESSKPLNDPGYKPEVSPDSPDVITPAHLNATDDDKSDLLPSPGAMAQPPPENSAPLPQH